MSDIYAETIVLVELSDGKPFHVATVSAERHIKYYDFDWCKRDESLYYECSGGGGGTELYMEHPSDARYWLASGYSVPETVAGVPLPGNAIEPLPEYTEEQPWDKLFSSAYGGDTVWCSTCEDHFPDDDTCEHIWWCDECEAMSTPDEPCEGH